MMFRNYDGRTYSVFFEDADETMVCTGTKEDDNADVATPVPSTNAVRNENPYDEIPLFKPVECNGYADEDGELHITAVKGEPEFRTDGTKEMYVSPSKQDTFGQLSIRLELWDHLERKVQKFRLRIHGENLSIRDFLSSRTQQRLDQMDR